MSPNNEHESESGADGRPDDAQTDDTKGDLAADNGGIDPSNETSLSDCLALTKEACSKGLKAPVVLMGYYNPFLAFGLEKLMQECR